MAISQSRSKSRLRKVYLIGLLVVAVGGWLLVTSALVWVAGFVRGNNDPGDPRLVWKVVGGVLLVGIGFAAMAGSTGFAERPIIEFEQHDEAAAEQTWNSRPFPVTELAATAEQEPGVFFGPPKPFIMIRCRRCETLNPEQQHACTHCDEPL